tara:strand:+ start:2797 stop:3462 length:666 start_codon:yes stop_codon:yes gene_type:complete
VNKKINIYIGYDDHAQESYDKCYLSILNKNTKYNLNIVPINYNTVKSYNRKKDKFESTQFSFARFFTPYESEYKGISIFVDSDFLFLDSIDSLIDLYDSNYAVQCCKHNYIPESNVKMNNKFQSHYPRKNWSSLMIFNNEHPKNKTLNPLTINNQSGAFLHRFRWLEDNEVGELPIIWNWLTSYYTETNNIKPKALHYTDGGPWLSGYADCKYADKWLNYG